jgi:hypothetical protein
MALRRLNIDFEALARAMAKQVGDENDYYLDTHTGRIMRIATDVWNALEEVRLSQAVSTPGSRKNSMRRRPYSAILRAVICRSLKTWSGKSKRSCPTSLTQCVMLSCGAS